MNEDQTKRLLAAIESIAASLNLLERPIADACMTSMHPPMMLKGDLVWCPECGRIGEHSVTCKNVSRETSAVEVLKLALACEPNDWAIWHDQAKAIMERAA